MNTLAWASDQHQVHEHREWREHKAHRSECITRHKHIDFTMHSILVNKVRSFIKLGLCLTVTLIMTDVCGPEIAACGRAEWGDGGERLASTKLKGVILANRKVQDQNRWGSMSIPNLSFYAPEIHSSQQISLELRNMIGFTAGPCSSSVAQLIQANMV